jgi:hypothetical protein
LRSTFISLAAIAAISLSACGSDSSSSVDDAAAEALPDACTLLSDDEVAQLTGGLPSTARFAGIEGSLSVCQWGDDTADFFSVTLQTDHDWDAQVEIAVGRGDAVYRELAGVGDRAYVELERFVQAEHDGVLVITGPVDEGNIGSLESMTNTIITRLP